MLRNPAKSALPAILAGLLTALSPLSASPSSGPWLESLDEAVELARATERNLLVDLWADWCLACKRLEEDVFSTTEFQDFAQKYVLLRVDTEDGAEGTQLMQRYQIEALPTTLILSPDMVKIGSLQGYLKTDQYIQNLELERMMYLLLVRAFNELDDGSDVDTTKMMADDFHSRQDGPHAAALYERLTALEDVDPDEAAWNHFLLADSRRLAQNWSGARDAVATARERATEIEDDNLLELVDLLPYQIARDEGDCKAAGAALNSFLRAHPDATHRKQALRAFDRILQGEDCR